MTIGERHEVSPIVFIFPAEIKFCASHKTLVSFKLRACVSEKKSPTQGFFSPYEKLFKIV